MNVRVVGPTLRLISMFLLIGCDRPHPLGKLPRSKLEEWAPDCSAPIIEEPALKGKDPSMPSRVRETPFQRATHRFFCKPPGWSIYVDGHDRIVGVCVDDKLRDPIEDEIERSKKILSKHLDQALVSDMTKGKCAFEPESIEHGLLRWKQKLPYKVNPDGSLSIPPSVGTLWTCCWEVKE